MLVARGLQCAARATGARTAASAAAAAAAPPAARPTAAERAILEATAGAPVAPGAPVHRKHYAPIKRASQTMALVRKDALERRQVFMAGFRPELPAFDVGDAVELVFALEVPQKEATVVRGTVMGITRRGIESSLSIINRLDDDVYIASYKLYSPLLRSLRVMRRRHVTGGTRRVRRAKLWDLWGSRYEGRFLVDRETKEEWESALERRIRRELQTRGRVASRRNVLEEKERVLRGDKGVLDLDM